MFRIPNPTFIQSNNSDKFGNIWATKNMNFDEPGYMKLSPRAVALLDEATTSALGVPTAFGFYESGQFQAATTSNKNFVVEIQPATFAVSADSGSSNPTTNTQTHGKFWQNRWHVSTDTTVVSKAANGTSSAAWTSRITGLTSGVRHYMEVFENRNTLCVSNGNVLKQYDTSYASSTDLTIPSDFEIVGCAYNSGKMGIITKVGSSVSARKEARFFLWDGTTSSASLAIGVGTDTCLAIIPYKSSFVIITRTGQIKYFNGGGFEELGAFPFYYEQHTLDFSTRNFGDSIVVDGDVIYMNVAFRLNEIGREEYAQIVNCPSGVWCFDPKVGLYHRWSPSASLAYFFTVNDGGSDPSTNIMTIASGTLPQTGSLVRYVRTAGGGIGGLSLNQDYYLIKVSSTTFKLATTREAAIAGVAIDITADDTGASYFYMYDLIDYSISYFDDAGAIQIFGDNTVRYRDVVFGGDYPSNSLSSNDTLCAIVPFLDNIGWAITPKFYSSGLTDTVKDSYIKFKKLTGNSSITVKVKQTDVVGFPISAPNILDTGSAASWISNREFTTNLDLSSVSDYLDEDETHEVEIEFVAGACAGEILKVTSIEESGSGYLVRFDEPVFGAVAGYKSYFILDTWKELTTVDADSDENDMGIMSFAPEGSSKTHQFKIELRGQDIKIEEIMINGEVEDSYS